MINEETKTRILALERMPNGKIRWEDAIREAGMFVERPYYSKKYMMMRERYECVLCGNHRISGPQWRNHYSANKDREHFLRFMELSKIIGRE